MDMPFATAQSMLDALRTHDISAQELLSLHLERIARYNPILNAMAISNEERARERAALADAAIAKGVLLGPLHGLPVTMKECIEVAGLPTPARGVERAHIISTTTAPVAQSVLDAGAVLLGKTNLPTAAFDWQTSNALFDWTNNPWDRTRTSGGGAAALAAGLTPLAFGCDLNGGLCIPAAFCGVYGHRPSETAVPRGGHIPGPLLENPAIVMNVIGPLARSATDLELALSIIAEPVVGEDVAWRLLFPPARHSTLATFRVAILPSVPWLPVDEEILASIDDLAACLRHLNVQVEEAQPKGFDVRKQHEAYSMLLSAIAFAHVGDDERASVIERLQQSSDPFARARTVGVTATVAQFLNMHGQRTRSRALFREFFRDFDVLLFPATITPAFPHSSDHISARERSLQVNGTTVPSVYLPIYAGMAAYNGLPATVFPWGRTRSDLPIGLQVIGPYLEDPTTIAFASLLECEFGGFTPPPDYP